MDLRGTFFRRGAALLSVSLLVIGLILGGFPTSAQAAAVEVSSGSLSDAFTQNSADRQFNITGNIAGCNIPSGYSVTIQSGGILTFDGCTNSGSITIASGGTLSASSFLNNGTISGTYGGILYDYTGNVVCNCNHIYIPYSVSGVSDVGSILLSSGTIAAASAGSGMYWVPKGETVLAVYDSNGLLYVPGASAFIRQYSITYQNTDGTVLTLTPSAYTAEDVSITLPVLSSKSSVFQGWTITSGTGVISSDGVTLTKASGDLILTCVWKSSEGGAGGMGGGSMGGGGGSVSGITVVSQEEDDEETQAVNQAVASGMSGGARIRNASSTTRRIITNDGGYDVQAMANDRQQQKRFPWQWIGLGLGVAIILGWVGFLIKKRSDEKTAAMYEKLNIH